MPHELIAPRYRPWFIRGAVAGALLGAVAALALDWYFSAGPGASSVDAGEAHGIWAIMLGFPLSLVLGAFGRGGFVLGAALVWGLLVGTVTTVVALIVARVRAV